MVEIVCEYLVKEGARGHFELAYGPGGTWSKMFAQSSGFRGTTVMRDAKDPRRYLTVDVWDSEAQREQALVECQDGYTEVQAAFDEWTESRTELGTFSVLTQAAVRPRGRAGRSRTGRKR